MDRYSENTAVKTASEKRKKPVSFLAKSIITVMVLLAVEVLLFLLLKNIDAFAVRFEWMISKLEFVRNYILQFMSGANNIALTILILLFIYFIKAYLPFLPLSIVCMMSGIMFGKYWWIAFFINLTGLAMMFYLRFNSGRVKGENYMQNLLRKNKYVRLALDVNGVSSYSLLAAFRFFPCFPINFVSRLYGANKDCKYPRYMLISLAAIAPRVYVYTRIGREIFNPFSRMFVILVMIIAAFSGLGVFIANTVFFLKRKNDVKSGKDSFESEQQAENVRPEETESATPDAAQQEQTALPAATAQNTSHENIQADIKSLRNKFNRRES